MNNVEEIAGYFAFDGEYQDFRPFGNGHINDTFAVSYKHDGSVQRYILQKINTQIFTRPKELMENIINVISHITKKIIENGGDASREALTPIFTKSGEGYLVHNNEYWRAYTLVEDATAHDSPVDLAMFKESAVTFGRFQNLLSDFPAGTLYESIQDFHNTKKRYEAFECAVEADLAGRAKLVKEEIEFVRARKEVAGYLVELLESGKLPLKVTHNDTKLNNVLIDDKTGKGICVIDLDTVMPGLSLYDFGDSIRFGASTAAEDEKDLDKVSMSLELFKAYTEGFLSEAKSGMTQLELKCMPEGAKIITFECGMRFLTDYLNGDTYFKVRYDEQNLDRCRTQFKLVRDMESKIDEMRRIVLAQ